MALPYNQRTCYCGQVTRERVGQSVLLTGWVQTRRDHGGMVFIDLRDRTGLVQLKFNPETDPKSHEAAGKLAREFCVAVRGDVVARPDGLVNKNLVTGEIEVEVRELDILTTSATPKFDIEEEIETNEELRLRYRFLDLRRPPMQRALISRHRIAKSIRDYFDKHGFIEIETPFLTKSTPEGARDYLVPSRVHQGCFYALPQSPQIFKQLLMMSGYDRYMQIVRCFRDEDLRADRQPEFTQLDLEMSFVQADDVMKIVEGCLSQIMKTIHGIDIPLPLPRMSYQQAMDEYGIDRPDTRYDLRVKDVTAAAGKSEFRVFSDAIAAGGVVRCIRLPGGGQMTRKELDTLTDDMKGIGAGGLPYVKVVAGEGKPKFDTGVAKFLGEEATAEIIAACGAEVGDAVFFAAGTWGNVCKHLAWLRETLARRRNLIPADKWNFLWVVEFPMFEFHEDDGRYYAMHHPFTSPLDTDLDKLTLERAGDVRAKAYDVVLNGIELGGGSIRIHRPDVQQKIFELLQLTPEEQQLKFGFLLEALRYGPPPHGGIALGLDRLVMLMAGLDNIRDTFSFPKTQRAFCPMTEAPSPVSTQQLDELGLRLARPPGG